MSNLPKLILFSSLTFLLILIPSNKVFAVSEVSSNEPPLNFSLDKMLKSEEIRQNKYRETGQETIYNAPVIANNFYSLIGKVGVCGILQCGPATEGTSMVEILAQGIALPYDHAPASAMAYTQDLMTNAGILAKPAHAQGIGFAGLAPLLPLWKTARNISYAVLTIVMVIIGFMIIFRMKIDPKTVITIQAALPKIVTTLIIITFSYPIAGFFIDVMYLAIAVVVQVLSTSVPPELVGNLGPLSASFLTDTARQQQEFMGSGLAGFWKLVTAVFSFGMVPGLVQQGFTSSGGNILSLAGVGTLITVLLTSIAGAVLSGPIIAIAFGGPVVLIMFIIALGLLFSLIRIMFLLINSYIQLMLNVIFAPLLLLQEAIPGQSAMGQWLQNIIANLIVFPTTVAIIYLSWIITSVAWGQNLWAPPMVLSISGGIDLGPFKINGNPLALVIGMGFIFMAPTMIANVKKMFHPKSAIPITAGTAFSPLTGAIGTGMGAASQFYYFKGLMDSFKPRGDGGHHG